MAWPVRLTPPGSLRWVWMYAAVVACSTSGPGDPPQALNDTAIADTHDASTPDIPEVSTPCPTDASCDVDATEEVSSAPDWSALRAAIDASELEHCSVLIGTAEGVVFSHDKGDSTPQTVYPIASASKWLSALTLLRLVDQGALSLSDTPDMYLGWWTDDPSDPRSAVTLEQLLSFTSGLAGDSGVAPGVPAVPCIEDGDTTLEVCAQAIYDNEFAYPPGETFYYGPTHLHVAGAMALAGSNQRWNQVFRAQFSELGLAPTTAFAFPSLDNPRLAGGATASAEDYGKILRALLGGELLSASSLAAMAADHTPSGVTLANMPPVTTTNSAWHYALGCWRECSEAVYGPSCDEAGTLSSPGAFGFYPWWDQRRGFWGVIATQLPAGAGASTTVPLGQAWAELAAEQLAPSR